MQSLVRWGHLFPAIKGKTALFNMLSAEVCQRQPFCELPRLGDVIEERFQEQLFGLPDPQAKPWMVSLGADLRRIILDNDEETARVRELGDRLAQTLWQVASGLETVPYISGTPAGTPRRLEVLWKDETLFVQGGSSVKMAKTVADDLGRVFGNGDIADAIKLCYDRHPEFVTEYLEENFNLAALEEVDPFQSSGDQFAGSEQRGIHTTSPDGHDGVDSADLLRSVFGRLNRQNSDDNVTR